MSAPSGIRVPQDLTAAFGEATQNAEGVRALVFVIEGESYKHLTTVKSEGSYTDDIALLPKTLPSQQTPASFAYRLDSKAGGAYEWMMVTFVPDDAGVRAKMLQASSRAGLLKSLGANNFKHDWFATSLSDLTPAALKSHLNHMLSPPPLTASEVALAEVKAAESEEAKRVALDVETSAARRRAVIGLGGKTKWQDGVADALAKVADRSDDGWIVTLEIPASDTAAIQLLKSETCKPGEVASKLPEKSPCYVFYSYPTPPPPKPAAAPAASSSPALARNTFQATQGGVRSVAASNAPRMGEEESKIEEKEEEGAEGAEVPAAEVEGLKIETDETASSEVKSPEAPSPAAPASPPPPSKGRVVFVYWCPSGSPVRFRMVYSTTVRGIQQDAMDKAGIDIVAKLETSDKSDLTESQIRDAVPKGTTGASGASNRFNASAFQSPTRGQSLPTPAPSSRGINMPATAPVFGAPAPAGAFGRPRPVVRASSAQGITASAPGAGGAASAPVSAGGAADDEEGDSADRIRSAFDAFGPRVNNSGGGFARPRPAGRR